MTQHGWVGCQSPLAPSDQSPLGSASDLKWMPPNLVLQMCYETPSVNHLLAVQAWGGVPKEQEAWWSVDDFYLIVHQFGGGRDSENKYVSPQGEEPRRQAPPPCSLEILIEFWGKDSTWEKTGQDGPGIFHSLCLFILRKNAIGLEFENYMVFHQGKSF